MMNDTCSNTDQSLQLRSSPLTQTAPSLQQHSSCTEAKETLHGVVPSSTRWAWRPAQLCQRSHGSPCCTALLTKQPFRSGQAKWRSTQGHHTVHGTIGCHCPSPLCSSQPSQHRGRVQEHPTPVEQNHSAPPIAIGAQLASNTILMIPSGVWMPKDNQSYSHCVPKLL